MASGQVAEYTADDTDYNDAPPWLAVAKGEVGQSEYLPANKRKWNPRVANYFTTCGFVVNENQNPLKTPWCAVFIGYSLIRGKQTTIKTLRARDFDKIGSRVCKQGDSLDGCMPGDIVINWRGKRDDGITGHIFFYLRHDDTHIYGIGGNQGDYVSEAKFSIDRMIEIRRVRPVSKSKIVKATGGSVISNATAEGIRQITPDVKQSALIDSVEQTKPMLEQLAPYMKWAALALTLIGVGLALYAGYQRYRDYKERGV